MGWSIQCSHCMNSQTGMTQKAKVGLRPQRKSELPLAGLRKCCYQVQHPCAQSACSSSLLSLYVSECPFAVRAGSTHLCLRRHTPAQESDSSVAVVSQNSMDSRTGCCCAPYRPCRRRARRRSSPWTKGRASSFSEVGWGSH